MNFLNRRTPNTSLIPVSIIAVGLLIATLGGPHIWIPIVLVAAIVLAVANNWRLDRSKKKREDQGKPTAEP
ncbi:uncharacterized membrane protein YoaK (UPF0700 family) [Arthrobacter bambusae]|nr:uncharacterized membrane protein YoaK (UPF0700 family) [Arthrobacter bambusae]MDQ0096716.1 uncharacterized membrane protein YoaK (UPF0700 family) [Arthrobacter bambusae]